MEASHGFKVGCRYRALPIAKYIAEQIGCDIKTHQIMTVIGVHEPTKKVLADFGNGHTAWVEQYVVRQAFRVTKTGRSRAIKTEHPHRIADEMKAVSTSIAKAIHALGQAMAFASEPELGLLVESVKSVQAIQTKVAAMGDKLWFSIDVCIRAIESCDSPVFFFQRYSVGLFDSPYLTDFNELTMGAGWDWVLHFDFKRMSLLLPNGKFAFYHHGRANGDFIGAIQFLNGLKEWQRKRESELMAPKKTNHKSK